MAEKLTNKEKEKSTDLYDRWKVEHNMSTVKDARKKYTAMGDIRDKYWESRNYLESSCTRNKATDSDSGGNWFRHVEKLKKAWALWYKPFSEDAFRSNVKSPMITGRVESAMHKIKSMSMGFKAFPTEDNDKGKAKIINEVINSLFKRKKTRYSLATWFKDGLMAPVGYVRVYYAKDVKEFSLAKGAVKDFTKDELKENKKRKEEKKQLKTFFKEPEDVVTYDDIVVEPIPFQEAFPDPNARRIQGRAFACTYFIRRRVLSWEQFQAEFKDDPNCFDVDKVKTGGQYDDDDLFGEYEFPKEITDGDFVEVLECENVGEDDYSIVANDMLIRGSYGSHKGPLPYNHKRITYVKIGAIEEPHQYHHRCIGDQLLAMQAEEEILKNMVYTRFHKTIDGSWIVNAKDMPKFVESYKATGGRFIPAPATGGRGLNQVVDFVERSPVDFGAFNALETIRQDATTATQFDPSQLASASKDKTATQSMMDKEVVDAFIVSVMESFGEGIIEVAEQVVMLMQQFYTIPKIKKITGEDGKEKLQKMYRSIRLDNKSIEVDGDAIEVKDSEEDYNFFEVKGEYLNLEGELNIIVSPDSMKVPSKGLEAKQSMEALAQMMQFAVNPNDPEASAKNPLPLVDAVKLMRWYAEANDIPEDVLLEKSTRPQAQKMQALLQSMELNKGKLVVSEAGESKEHIDIHEQLLNNWLTEEERLKQAIMESTEAQMAQMAPPMPQGPMMMPTPPEPQIDPALEKAMKQVTKIIDVYKQHIMGDAVPKINETGELMSRGQEPPMPGGGTMPMPGGGMEGQGPPMPPGGMPGMPGMEGMI